MPPFVGIALVSGHFAVQCRIHLTDPAGFPSVDPAVRRGMSDKLVQLHLISSEIPDFPARQVAVPPRLGNPAVAALGTSLGQENSRGQDQGGQEHYISGFHN